MATQITATLPTLNFPKEVDYPTQEDWAAFSAAAELNFGILGGSWSTQMQLWKTEANAMSTELNTNATIAQSLANYQGDWTSKGYTLGQTVSVSGVYYICKLTHATGQNPTSGGSLYWNLALGNWNSKVNNYGNETIAGVKTFSSNIVGNITGNAGTATIAADSNKLVGKNWYWSGQGGQPTWLWGGSDGTDMYVYNPSNFNVNYANTCNRANDLGNHQWDSKAENGYIRLSTGLIIQWGSGLASANTTLPVNYPIAFSGKVLILVGSIGGASNGLQPLGFVPTASKAQFNISNFNVVIVPYFWLSVGY